MIPLPQLPAWYDNAACATADPNLFYLHPGHPAGSGKCWPCGEDTAAPK